MSYVFNSKASQTRAAARQVAEALRAQGLTVWGDEDLPPHRPFSEVIEERLQAAKAVVVVWSEAAVHSQWVRAEADVARNAGKLVQVSVDGVLPPLPFNQIHSEDLSHWRGEAADPHWRKVADSVAALVGEAPSDPMAGAPGPRRGRRKAPLWVPVAAAFAVTAAIAAGWFLLRPAPSALPSRVAVLPFDTTGGSQDVTAFASGLQDEVLGALSNNHVETISRTESVALRDPNADSVIARLRVGLLLDGSVQETAGMITVRLHLDDAGDHATLWSEDFTRPAAETEALQAEVAARAARIMTQALGARAAGVSDQATLSDFVTGDEIARFGDEQFAAAEAYFRRVIARAPRFAGGHAYLANALAFGAWGNPQAENKRAEARREADAAIRLDPRGYDAYVALALLAPPGDFRAYEAPLLKGQAVDPTNPTYPYFLGDGADYEGRNRAAVDLNRRTVAMDPYWPGPTKELMFDLASTGQTAEADRLLDRMQRLWPGVWATRAARFWMAAVYGDPDDASALLADPKALPEEIAPQSVDLWRSALTALKSNQPATRTAAAAAVKASALAGQFSPPGAVMLLVGLGDLDGAFAVANAFPGRVIVADGNGAFVLFIPPTAPLRRDPRFMAFAARAGLVTYWRATGNWPDFCSEPGLPYDCKTEAAKYPG